MKTCAVTDCTRPYHTAGYCNAHHKRWMRHGDPLAGGPTPPPPLILEDVEWMVETGESLTIAARRTGRSLDAFWRALQRAGRLDLFHTLAARERDWNAPSNREAIVRSPREERRRSQAA